MSAPNSFSEKVPENSGEVKLSGLGHHECGE